MIIRQVISMALLSLTIGTCDAQTRSMVGDGMVSCGAYVEASKTHPDAASRVEAWVWGYMSALNMHYLKADYIKQTDGPGINAALKQYCEHNPLKLVVEGTYAVFTQLGAKIPANTTVRKK